MKLYSKKYLSLLIIFVISGIVLFKKINKYKIYNESIELSFIEFNEHNKDIIEVPPFLNKEKLIITVKKFRNPDSSFSFLNWFVSHYESVTYASLSSEWLYAFEVNISDIEYWVLMNKSADILYENQDPKGANEIRKFLHYVKGEEWFSEMFSDYKASD